MWLQRARQNPTEGSTVKIHAVQNDTPKTILNVNGLVARRSAGNRRPYADQVAFRETGAPKRDRSGVVSTNAVFRPERPLPSFDCAF